MSKNVQLCVELNFVATITPFIATSVMDCWQIFTPKQNLFKYSTRIDSTVLTGFIQKLNCQKTVLYMISSILVAHKYCNHYVVQHYLVKLRF